MKTINSITRFSDLDREELRVKRRLKKTEELMRIQLKTMPEEILTTGITKIISQITSGNLFRSTISIIKNVGSSLVGNKDNDDGNNKGVMQIIKNVIKDIILK